ncbi:MAG: HAD hydrolase-like protein [Lachnospiraceae bacterium]|nr:HAD hydrolase-like protein [Lachnospiraceae bacterium]
MKKAEVIIFDLDGTLFNTRPGIVKAIKKTIETEGLSRLEENEFDRFIGPPINQTFSKVFNLSDEEGKRLADIFRQYYHDPEYLLDTREYPGIRETLKELKNRGIKTALATYKKEKMAEEICAHFGYDALLDVIHGSDREGKLTKQDIIKLCLKDCGVSDPGNAVMIGDSIFDAKGAESAGTMFAGVTYGFGFKNPEDILKFPGAGVINRAEEILEL